MLTAIRGALERVLRRRDVPYRQPTLPHDDKPYDGPVRVAPSLREAGPHDLLWLDRDGNVRPLSPLRSMQLRGVPVMLPVGLLACGALAVFADGLRVFATVVGLLYVFVGALAYWGLVARKGVELATRGRGREAEAIADRLLAHHVLAAAYQPSARLIKARVALREQRWADAVEQYRAMRYARTAAANRFGEMALYEEIVALCNADRLDDAKDLLARAPRPTGDFLELLHDTARMLVAFTLDDPSLVPTADVEKMLQYERHATGWGVLAMVGWHARKNGNEPLARRSIDAERSKPHGEFERRLPAVARWLDHG